MEKIWVKPIWFDSLGAKSACTLVKTPDITLLIDPGAAEMQPSYPLSWAGKVKYLLQARRAIQQAARQADWVIISHYHYDHHTLLTTSGGDGRLYQGKIVWAKDPNQWINKSQWGRARLFFDQICREFGETKLATVQKDPERVDYEDPMEGLPLAREKDWGTYAQRKGALVEKGRRWFRKLAKTYWSRKPWLQEFKFKDIEVRWADGRQTKVGRTRIEFSKPRFHGLEFDRVGWIFSTMVKIGREKFIHTSDLEGVQLEDYREALIKENPDFLVVDGPATYLFGFMINRINLNRCIENLCKLIREIDGEVIILDHHLLRERRYRERLKKVWLTAKVENKKVLTAAEFLGKKPVVLSLN